MSQRAIPPSVAERIEEVRKATPPPSDRKARKSYISKDDFAKALGVSRTRPYAWTRERDPEYPDEHARRALAKLSGGRYEPDDFARPSEPGTESLDRRLSALEAAVENIERHLFGEDAAPG